MRSHVALLLPSFCSCRPFISFVPLAPLLHQRIGSLSEERGKPSFLTSETFLLRCYFHH
jgi:hypothetical protein